MINSIKKVLIVEDEAIIAKNLSMIVQRIGFETVAIISKGKEVESALKRYKPDIILMDILLDDELDGITAAGLIKKYSDIPVIFITSNTQPEFVDKALLENPFGYIIKPFRETEIKYAIMLANQRIAINREIQKNQNDIKKLKDFYNTTLNAMTDWVIVLNQKCDIIYCNDSFNYTFGGINLTPSFEIFITEESNKDKSGLLYKIFLTGKRDLKVISIKDLTGEIRTYNISVSPIYDDEQNVTLAVVSGRDISELIYNLEYLTTVKMILNNVIQSVPTGIILTNSEGVITLTNKTFESMSSFTFSELEGKDITFLQMKSLGDNISLADNIANDNFTPVELELKNRDSGSFTAKIIFLNFEKPLSDNFKIIYFITDISFEKKLEKKQVQLQNHIESIVREMDDLSELLLETNVYNQSIKRGDIGFDIVERNILKFIESGMTNKQIASRLEIAEITVKKRLSSIYSKLGIKNKYQLIEYLHTNFVPDKKF